MKQYLSADELDLVHNHNHVIVTKDTNPDPDDCSVLPLETVKNGDYIECGELEVEDKQGTYGHGLKYSLLSYWVAISDLGTEVNKSDLAFDKNGDIDFNAIDGCLTVVNFGKERRYFIQ